MQLKKNNQIIYHKENIVAIATANIPSPVGIVRISGTNLLPLIKKVTNLSPTQHIKPRHAYYVDFIDTIDKNKILDSGILLYFKAPNSFTGEDVIELHGHGNPISLNLILKACLNAGCRQANAGEFSKRAFLNNKINLTQAESILDLIHAESETQVLGAVKSLKGEFSNIIDQYNVKLINIRMFVEATLDFPEEDIEFITNAKIKDKLINLQQNLQKILRNTEYGVILNNGLNIIILGRPNVGKSSLLNRMAQDEIAIVTDIAGTTRDIIKEKIIISGITCNIIDTAGIRQTTDTVEQIGIKRTLDNIALAQLCLIIIDSTMGLTQEDKQLLQNIPPNIPKLFVHNKIDLLNNCEAYKTSIDSINIENDNTNPNNINTKLQPEHIFISAKQNTGIADLQQKILNIIGIGNSYNVAGAYTARTRHVAIIKDTIQHITTALNNWQHLEIIAEELRYAHTKLSEITGEFITDDLLGEIFHKFCIGK